MTRAIDGVAHPPQRSWRTEMSTLASSPQKYVFTTVTTAITAALAAAAALTLSLPVWAMFVGWVAFFTRGLTMRSAFENLGCVGAGMLIGVLAALAIRQLAPI